MARDPGSMWSPLVEWNDQGSHAKNAVIIHSTGDRGSALAIYNYFNRPEVVVESTFVVGLSPADPTRQMLDSASVADANMQANARAISIEVVGQATDDYTDWQVQEILRICRWAMKEHGIPPHICANPDDAGFGWHVMFGAPGPWAAVAKECPGQTRIGRLTHDIFPALFADPSTPTPAVQEDDDDMALLIRNPKGAVHLIVGDRNIPIKDGKDFAALGVAGLKTANISDALFADILANTRAEG